jgi:RecA/RadA recombinase
MIKKKPIKTAKADKPVKEVKQKELKEPKIPSTIPTVGKDFQKNFSDLNNILSKFSEDGDVLDVCKYAKIAEFISTGIYILNACISGSIFGGMPNNRSLVWAGEEGSGKTYLSLSIARNGIPMGYIPIYFDTEGSMDPEFCRRLGVDPKYVRIEPIHTVSEFMHYIAKMLNEFKAMKKAGKAIPKVMIIFDSLGNTTTEKEMADAISGSDKRDMTKQQNIRALFRVVGLDLSMFGIPFIVNNHVYEKVGSYIPGKQVSGGGGILYNASIINMLTKSQLVDDKKKAELNKAGIEATKVGITITVTPLKQRFARTIKAKIHIPFYKKPNPFVGLENFVTWDSCGIVRGKCLTEKEYLKLDTKEQKKCHQFLILIEGLSKGDDGTRYAYPKDSSRTLVCRHLGGEISLTELFTEKVFTQEILHELDEKIIKPAFMLPDIESLEDLKEISDELGGEEEVDLTGVPEIVETEVNEVN